MREWFRQPWVARTGIAISMVVALVGSFAGATFLLSKTPPGAVEAAEDAALATTAPAAPTSGPIVIHATGDVLLDPTQLGLLAQGYEAPWSGVRDLFASDDLSIINLECSPGTGGSAEDKEFTFRCPRGFEAMKESGIDVANLGNNHSGDFGKEPLISGMDAINHAGIATVGAGRNATEANEPAIFKLRGKTVAVLGFGGVVPSPNWIARTGPGVADGYDVASMVDAVKRADEHADIVLVTLHWGEELDTEPLADDIGRAQAMIDAGADAIFGHHAHVLQPLHVYKERPIFYGLGNFVWPRAGPTAVAEVVIDEDGSVRGCLLPATISGGRPSLADPKASCP
ncbi:MAG: CapA family protein [Actinomycetota bacterium]